MRSGNTQTFSINASLVVSNWRDMYISLPTATANRRARALESRSLNNTGRRFSHGSVCAEFQSVSVSSGLSSVCFQL